MKRLMWKLRKIWNPSLVAERNANIMYMISRCECIREDIGEQKFNRYWGRDYIENLRKELV